MSEDVVVISEEESTKQGQEDEPHTPQQRQMAAVGLRAAGWDYKSIAVFHGFANAAAARAVVERALADTVTDKDIDNLRKLTRMRLDRLLNAVWSKAIDPKSLDHLQYVKTALSIIDRQANLDGLNAPTQHEIIGPDKRDIIQWVTDVAARSGFNAQVEAEIIDAEIEAVTPNE